MSEAQLHLEQQQLSITQIFDASIEKLFACFTQPDLLNQWHAPGNMQIDASVDLRVGGAYRIAMTDDDGKTHTAIGEYREIEAPNKLIYTWSWEGGEDQPTTVEVLFKSLGDKTEVALTHTNFANHETATHHSQGWAGIYARLEQWFSSVGA